MIMDEGLWVCDRCNNLQGKHNLRFNGICSECHEAEEELKERVYVYFEYPNGFAEHVATFDSEDDYLDKFFELEREAKSAGAVITESIE